MHPHKCSAYICSLSVVYMDLNILAVCYVGARVIGYSYGCSKSSIGTCVSKHGTLT